MTSLRPNEDKAYVSYQSRRRAFWDRYAGVEDTTPARYYHTRLQRIFRSVVPEGVSVVEIGSGDGDLLAALAPKRGLGIDFSKAHVGAARKNHPDLEFLMADVHDMSVSETFDYVIISDLINDIWDVQTALEQISKLCHPGTRIVINSFNKLWHLPISLARRIGIAQPLLRQNWLSVTDIQNLLVLTGYQPISTSGEILMPIGIPGVSALFNRFLVKLWPLNHLALTQVLVARPHPGTAGVSVTTDASVSIVVPARNEAGHIHEILERVPKIGSRTEILFVEGNSTDETWEVIQQTVNHLDDPNIRCYQQPGIGKGDAVRHGYSHATGDVLMILDADMTVAPEDLPRFFDALTKGAGEFVNGVRLIYPMEEEAMQFLNFLGNKFFGLTFSWLLRQPVKDTLCGTKVLSRASYDTIAANRDFFGDFDPFGDFDLLFGAAKANFKIVDVPIRYRQRRYGSTNIDRWRHGVLLLKMAWFAARKLRFV